MYFCAQWKFLKKAWIGVCTGFMLFATVFWLTTPFNIILLSVKQAWERTEDQSIWSTVPKSGNKPLKHYTDRFYVSLVVVTVCLWLISCVGFVDAGFRFKPDDVPKVQVYDNGVLKVSSSVCICCCRRKFDAGIGWQWNVSSTRYLYAWLTETLWWLFVCPVVFVCFQIDFLASIHHLINRPSVWRKAFGRTERKVHSFDWRGRPLHHRVSILHFHDMSMLQSFVQRGSYCF